MEFNRNAVVRALFAQAADRVIEQEDLDPAMAVVGALCSGTQVPDSDLELVFRAHNQGPWAITSDSELQIFARWCEAAGAPLEIGEPEAIEGLRLYRNNFGDCILAESTRGAKFAVWTRKGRLHVGFREESDAVAFRAVDPKLFSLEATGNKRLALVVIEGGDTFEMIANVSRALLTVKAK